MNTSDATNTPKDCEDGGFIAFSNDNPSSNWRKTPFKSSYTPHDQFSPQFHGSPQGFSSPIYHQRNFNGNRRQSGNSYGDRFRGNQSYNRGNNWKNRNDNRRPNNRSFNKSGCGTVDISEYFHPSMIQDPWKSFQQNPSEGNILINKYCEESNPKANDQVEPGGSPSI